MLASGLFIGGRYALGAYLAAKSDSTYGAAGSVFVVLLWVYYSAQIFLFGAAVARAGLLKTLAEGAGHSGERSGGQQDCAELVVPGCR